MTDPKLSLSAPDSILVGEAFETTITASNPGAEPVSTVSLDAPETLAHRLTPDGPLPSRRLIPEPEAAVVVEDDEDDGGPPGSDDDEEDVVEEDLPEDDPVYFVLSGLQKRQALLPDDRVMLPPTEMVDLAPGETQEYPSWPSDLLVEPIPAGRYGLTGILIGAEAALETPTQPLQIRRLAASSLVACTHIGGTRDLVAYAHAEGDSGVSIYQHITGPGGLMGPGYRRGQAGAVDSLAQTCGGDEMQMGPFWLAWVEGGTFRAALGERQFDMGQVSTELDLPGATLAPLGWQSGNDAMFFLLGTDGEAALASVSVAGGPVVIVTGLFLDLPGEVASWQVRRGADGGFNLVTAHAVDSGTKVLATTIAPDFGSMTGRRELFSSPYPFAALAVEADGTVADVAVGPVTDLPERPGTSWILNRVPLDGAGPAGETVVSGPQGGDVMLAAGPTGPVALARDGSRLLALRDGPPATLTENLADPSPIIAHGFDGASYAVVADPDWGLVYLQAY